MSLPEIQLRNDVEQGNDMEQGGIHIFPVAHTNIQFSPSISNLVTASAEARNTFKTVVKSSKNPHYKSDYAGIEEVIDAVDKSLSEKGIVIFQMPTSVERNVVVTTLLSHKSGEWLLFHTEVPASQGSRFDVQTVGGAITYARRYALKALLFLAEEDDDGNSLVQPPKDKQENPRPFSGQTAKSFPGGGVLTQTTPTIATAKFKATDEDLPDFDTMVPPDKATSSSVPVEDTSLPTPEQRSDFVARLKAIKVDGRSFKGFAQRRSGVSYSDIPAAKFEKIVLELEQAAKISQEEMEKLIKS